jgi:hypothetical protein
MSFRDRLELVGLVARKDDEVRGRGAGAPQVFR